MAQGEAKLLTFYSKLFKLQGFWLRQAPSISITILPFGSISTLWTRRPAAITPDMARMMPAFAKRVGAVMIFLSASQVFPMPQQALSGHHSPPTLQVSPLQAAAATERKEI